MAPKLAHETVFLTYSLIGFISELCKIVNHEIVKTWNFILNPFDQSWGSSYVINIILPVVMNSYAAAVFYSNLQSDSLDSVYISHLILETLVTVIFSLLILSVVNWSV